MMQKILTSDGYKPIAAVKVGDAVVAYDPPETGALQHNVIERVEWISKQDYQICNAPQGYNEGEDPPGLKPESVPFDFYVINNTFTLFQDQSVWYERDGSISVYHAKDIAVGDTLFDETDTPFLVASVGKKHGDGWWRFAISGDHSYVVDGLTLHNANRFWLGGGSANTWAATANTNWGTASGSGANASVPGVSDVAIFDNNSGVGNSVIGANITIQNMDCGTGGTAYGGTLTHNTAVTLTCNTGGTFRFSSGMTYTPASTTSIVTFTHTSGTMTLTSAGKAFAALTINGAGGTTTLADALKVNAVATSILTLTTGTLDAGTNTAAMTVHTFNANNSNTKALTLGGTVTLGGNVAGNQGVWQISATGTTFTKNSANIVVLNPTSPNGGWSFNGGGLTYNAITLTASGFPHLISFSGTSTFSGFTYGAGYSFLISNGVTLTISSAFNINATPLLPCNIFTSATQTANISCPSGACAFNWCAIEDISFSGGATFTAKNSFNCGLNSGITITPPGMGPTTEPVHQRAFKAGATSQSVDIFIQDSSNLGGAGLTGLVYNASGLTAYYRKGQTGTSTSIVLATQTVGGVYSSGGLVEIDSVNMPGVYRLDVPDTVIAAAGNAEIYLQGAANMVPCIVPLEIVAYDPTDSVRLGLTALPNAAAAANGGLPTVDATNSVAITSNIKKNTAKAGFMLVMTDSTSHVPTAGLAVTATRSIDGAAFGACTNAVSGVANGTYVIDLSAADMNGNHIMLRFTAASADDLNIEIITQP